MAKKKRASAPQQVEVAVGTLERGLAILQHFKRTPDASIADVATALGLSRSTTYRIAERLRELGFLEINAANARWRLGSESSARSGTVTRFNTGLSCVVR